MLSLKILSEKQDNSNVCFISEGNLEDYILSLPEKYKEYDIQRGIVKNSYLDNLTETVLSNGFVPPIVLISEDAEITTTNIIFNNYKILDGLQRTVRLQNIFKAFKVYLKLLVEYSKEEIEQLKKVHLSKLLREKFHSDDVEIVYLLSIIQHYKISQNVLEKDIFKKFKQWFIIWNNLDKVDQVNNMLILNAGHKSMDLKHQLELLVLNILSEDFLNSKYTISGVVEETSRFVRAKEVNSAYFYKNKKAGQLHLSHLISALIAFERTIPFTLKQDDLQKIQNDDESEFENLKIFFENDNIDKVINFIEKIDLLFKNNYPANNEGLQWLGRESVLIGLFSAFGKYYKKQLEINPDLSFSDNFEKIYLVLEENIIKYKINNFNEAKKNIDITKLNIGNVFKFTTYYATCKILFNTIDEIDWKMFFNKYSKKVDDECI